MKHIVALYIIIYQEETYWSTMKATMSINFHTKLHENVNMKHSRKLEIIISFQCVRVRIYVTLLLDRASRIHFRVATSLLINFALVLMSNLVGLLVIKVIKQRIKRLQLVINYY